MTNSTIKKLIKVLEYFFTPEDTATPVWHGSSTYNIEFDIKGIGAAKALFWTANSVLFVYLISLL